MLGRNYFTVDIENLKSCPPRNGRKFTVSVEGNIGCGKSTFLDHFKQIPGIQVEPEPVNLWKNVGGSNLLELMYKDASRWSFAFQSYVQLTMLNVHESNKKNSDLKIMERSIYSAKYCFVENLYKNNLMSEIDYCVLTEWFDWILEHLTPKIDLIVYLKAKPETCQRRIQSRNRNEEKCIPIEYLKALDELHEEWLTDRKFPVPAPVIVVDTETDLKNLAKKYEELKPQILFEVGH